MATMLHQLWNDLLIVPVPPSQFAAVVAFVALFWFSLFRFLAVLFPKTSPEVLGRVLGLFYTLITAPVSTYFLLTNATLQQQYRKFLAGESFDIVNIACPIISFLAPHLVGVLVFEVMIMPYQGTFHSQRLMLIHHLIPMIAFPVLTCQSVGHVFLLYWYSTEASTPFLQMRWLLEHFGFKSSPLYAINGIVFALIFFIFRVFPIPLYLALRFQNWDLFVKRGTLPFLLGSLDILSCGLNVYWAQLIGKGLLKAFLVAPTAKQNSKKE